MRFALLDDNPGRREPLSRTLGARGLRLEPVAGRDALPVALASSDAIVVVGSLAELASLVGQAQSAARQRPLVLVTRQGSLGDLMPLLYGAVYGLVTFAEGTDALVALLQEVRRDIEHGALRMSSADAARRGLLMLRRAGACGLLQVTTEGESGQILLRDGHVVDAESGALRGEDAAAALIARIDGEVQLAWTELGPEGAAAEPEGSVGAGAPDEVLDAAGLPLPALDAQTLAQAGTLRVLLADDDPALRAMYRSALHHRGFELIEATDGREALQLALAQRPELILSDVMMPRLDGWGLLAAVRSDHRLRETPFAMLSCHAEYLGHLERLGAGADAYLAKGVRLEEIVARLRALAAPRLQLLAGITPGRGLRGRCGRLGPLTLMRALEDRNASGLLVVEDRWVRVQLWFASGLVASASARVGAVELRDVAALRALLGARRACWQFDPEQEPTLWSLRRAARALVEQIASQANEDEKQVHERMMAGTQQLVFDSDVLDFYEKVCPPALTPVLARVRAGQPPRAIIGSGLASPLVVDWLFKDMLAKGAVRFVETS